MFTADFDLFVKFMTGFVCLLSWQQPLRKPQKCLCQHLCQLPICPQVRTDALKSTKWIKVLILLVEVHLSPGKNVNSSLKKSKK